MYGRMSPMQDAAAQTLVLQGFLDPTAFEGGDAALTGKAVANSLESRISAANLSQRDLMTFLCVDLDAVPFNGPKGLKDLTGLGEYRYDIA